MNRQRRKTDIWTHYATWLLYGTYLAGKLVVVVAAPLLALVVFNRALTQRVYAALTRRTPLSGLAWALLVFVMYGLCETVYGLLQGYKPILAFEVLVFNLSPIYLFVGLWAGERRPDLVKSFVRFTIWFNTIYALLYFLFLSKLNFGNPASGTIPLIGLFSFETSLLRSWFPILILSFSTIASQIRGSWVGLTVGLLLWGIVSRKIGRMLSAAGVLVALLVIGFIFDLSLPGLPGRGGDISARETIGRALSPFDPEMAREFSSNSATYAGTVHWRETWWREIRETVSQDPRSLIFGMGYGYPIADLVPYLKGTDLRTPHSVFYFCLAYSGSLGVALFMLLQGCIIWLLWRTYKVTGQAYGLVLYVALFTEAFFGNFFEAPQSVVPIYIVVGMCIGSQFSQTVRGATFHLRVPRSIPDRSFAVSPPEQAPIPGYGRNR